MAVHHHQGMMEPMMMGMMDTSGVGLNYTTNRPTFPPPHAHASVLNPMPNHPHQTQPLPQHPPTSIPTSSASNNGKPKKPRKLKKSPDGSPDKPNDDANKQKKKKNSNKPKQKTKSKNKPGDGSEYFLKVSCMVTVHWWIFGGLFLYACVVY